MPSFDIVSEINKVDLGHAVDNAAREVGTRFDFKGCVASIEQKDLVVTLKSESEFQVQQLEDLFRNHCAKRNVSTSGIEKDAKPVHTGKTFAQHWTFKEGIDQTLAKDIVKRIKENGFKVQSSIQGDKVRVTGKKRDDLQTVIAYLKQSDIEQPLQFENFRE